MRNNCKSLHFDPDHPQAYFGHACRFKGGGGGGSPPSSSIGHTERSKRISSQLFPAIENAMDGKMFGGDNTRKMYARQLNQSYNQAFRTAAQDYRSDMNRIIDPQDTRVKDFMNQQIKRDWFAGKDVINRQLNQEAISDKDMGFQMAADAVAMDQRMAVSGAQMYNQALQTNMLNERQFGTFGTNVAGGIGSGLMDMYFAKQMAG